MISVKCPNHCKAEKVSEKEFSAGTATCSSCGWQFDKASVIGDSVPASKSPAVQDESEVDDVDEDDD